MNKAEIFQLPLFCFWWKNTVGPKQLDDFVSGPKKLSHATGATFPHIQSVVSSTDQLNTSDFSLYATENRNRRTFVQCHLAQADKQSSSTSIPTAWVAVRTSSRSGRRASANSAAFLHRNSQCSTADTINWLGLILSNIIACSFLSTLTGPKSGRKTKLITLIDSVKLVNVICLLKESKNPQASHSSSLRSIPILQLYLSCLFLHKPTGLNRPAICFTLQRIQSAFRLFSSFQAIKY